MTPGKRQHVHADTIVTCPSIHLRVSCRVLASRALPELVARTPATRRARSRRRAAPRARHHDRRGAAAPAGLLPAGAQGLREAGERVLRVLRRRRRAGARHRGARFDPPARAANGFRSQDADAGRRGLVECAKTLGTYKKVRAPGARRSFMCSRSQCMAWWLKRNSMPEIYRVRCSRSRFARVIVFLGAGGVSRATEGVDRW